MRSVLEVPNERLREPLLPGELVEVRVVGQRDRGDEKTHALHSRGAAPHPVRCYLDVHAEPNEEKRKWEVRDVGCGACPEPEAVLGVVS